MQSKNQVEFTGSKYMLFRFANKYEEMLQPLRPVTTLPCKTARLPPRGPGSSKRKLSSSQCQFESVIANGDVQRVEKFLSRHSTDVNMNQYNGEGRTALQQSCLEGNLPLAKVLVKYGANCRLTTRDGFSTIHLAAFSGHSNLTAYILSLQ